MNTSESVRVMLEIFSAIERRDPRRVFELCQPDVQFLWPPSLPYGGASPGSAWANTWSPLQPTEAERKMDPRVVAAGPDEVVVLWQQRGVSPAGDGLETPVLGVYQLRKGNWRERRCSTSIRRPSMTSWRGRVVREGSGSYRWTRPATQLTVPPPTQIVPLESCVT